MNSEDIDQLLNISPSRFNLLDFSNNSSFMPDKNLSMICQNIRSIRKNFDFLLSHLNCFKHDPDIIFLTEIWINSNESNFFKIDNYNFFAATNDDRRSSGVGCFLKSNLRSNFESFLLKTCDVLKLNCCIESRTFTFLCIYRFHEYRPRDFIDEFSTFLKKINTSNLIVTGDVNIDILDNDSDKNLYIGMMASHGFQSIINEPTRTSSGSCVDHIFVRLENVLVNNCMISVCDFNVTDHSMVGLIVNNLGTKISQKVPKGFKTRVDYEKLKIILLYEFWDDVYCEQDINKAYDLFINKLNTHISNCSVQIKMKKSEKFIKPWMSRSLLSKIKHKNKLNIRRRNNPSNFELNIKYLQCVKKTKKQISITKNNFYNKKLVECKGILKKEWAVVNEILNKSSKHKINSIKHNGEIIARDEDIANIFNDYFSTITNELTANFPISCSCEAQYEKNQVRSFVFEEISSFEIFTQIKKLKNKHSFSLDEISNIVLKNINTYVVDVLAFLFNRSIVKGVFPNSLKLAKIIPLFKKGDASIASNYRPISLLPVVSKLFEKLMKKRMLKFMNKNQFFSDGQFGFREGRSTEVALLVFCENILKGLDNEKFTASLFVDLTKAFDLVSHEILLKKLSLIGFRGFILDWFKSYLYDRTQIVCVNDAKSNKSKVNIGVPQGSVLGPILFLVYINSLLEKNFKGKVTAFADDIGLVYNSKSVLDIQADIEYDLAILRNWFACHQMVISNKTKVMFFSLSRHSDFDVPVYFHSPDCKKLMLDKKCIHSQASHGCSFNVGCLCSDKCFNIESVSEFKYLGLVLDFRLSWIAHSKAIMSYMNYCIRCFYYLKKSCNENILKTVYYGIAQSKIQYGLSCWGGCSCYKTKSILIAQKCILRIICNKPRLHESYPLFKCLRILPIRHLYCFKVLKIFYSRSGHLNYRFSHTYSLRSNSRRFVNVPAVRTATYENSFQIASRRLFNALPDSFRHISSIHIFLRRIKIWLLDMDYQQIENLFVTVV